MFQKGRQDLLERIVRQQSRPIGSSMSPLITLPIENNKDTNEQKAIDRLSQEQRLSFFQLKELELRVDCFEKDLSRCYYLFEQQNRLIKDLLCVVPNEGKNGSFVKVILYSAESS